MSRHAMHYRGTRKVQPFKVMFTVEEHDMLSRIAFTTNRTKTQVIRDAIYREMKEMETPEVWADEDGGHESALRSNEDG